MQDYKQAFTRFLISEDALQFGNFELKNGRKSPYFFNSSRFNTARKIEALGSFYASAIEEHLPGCTIVFGPAYKGIPLCLTIAMALARNSKKDIGYFFNRKEKKSHGDRGWLLGKKPSSTDTVILVDDVITDGQTKIEALETLKTECDAEIDAVFVAFDRMEKNLEGRDAKAAFEQQTGIPVYAIANIREIFCILKSGLNEERPLCDDATLKALESYLKEYGVSET